MLSIAIIVTREVLEISLILGVVLAATRSLRGRARWIAAGLAGGVIGSAIVAMAAGAISDAIGGMGQEIFNATILLMAAALIAWTVIWMKRHCMSVSKRLREVGVAVTEGRRPFYVLAVVIWLSMLREGSEIVLLSYGVLVSGVSVSSLVAGALVGIAAGSLVGVAMYLGLVRIVTRHVFSITSAMLVFLAAGMVSQAIEFLGAAGIVGPMSSPLWDSSFLLSEHSVAGSALHTLIGYSAQPTGLQLAAYVGTVVLIALTLWRQGTVARS